MFIPLKLAKSCHINKRWYHRVIFHFTSWFVSSGVEAMLLLLQRMLPDPADAQGAKLSIGTVQGAGPCE